MLAAPDQTIVSQFAADGSTYPPQFTDVSYGVAGPVVVSGSSPSRYLIPTGGSLGTSWTTVSFNAAANGFTAGKAAVGYDTTASPVNYADHFQTAVPTSTTSVYIRTEFDLPSAAAVTSLDLNLKYDDGIVVYLNGHKVVSELAPASPVWNSLATGSRGDSVVVAGNAFPLNAYLPFLQSGKNVLAIQLLNQNGSSDLLVDPVLTAQSSSTAIGYLSQPTPGLPNSAIAQIGPTIESVVFAPNQPVANQPITVTAHLAAFAAPVNPSSVLLTYRVMYGSEIQVAMFDDGVTAGDAVAGDGNYTAQIPNSAFAAGQMVRWYVTAADGSSVISRAPTYSDPLDSPQYFGTVVADPSITTSLPVIHWFVQNPNAAATDAGTRASLSMFGQFYDNIQVDLHGQSTTQPQFTKKSFNFDANNGLKFDFTGTLGSVSDFNLLTNLTDKTYVRNTLAYDVYTEAGGPGLEAFSAVVQRNGVYYGLYDVVEEAQSEFLERVGLDPDGALYKMGNGFDSATNLVEKKTRQYENNSDLQQLVNTASLNGPQGEIWVGDNLDLASWVNYLAVQTLIANRDYGQKNYYLYRDSNDTKLWSLLPWDVDLSFGHQWNPTENYFDDDLIWNDGAYVYMGGNHLINRLIAMPQFTQMYARRLRTLTDEFYGPPGQPIGSSAVVQQIDALITQIGADALIDRNKWGAAAGMAFETPTQAIARVEADFLAKRKTHLNGLAGVLPSQVANPNVTFGAVDYNPTSGNQAQEYIAVVNHSSVAVDVSGWTLAGAASHTFKGGTVIPANATYYVVADVAQFKLRTSGPSGGQKLFIQGNFDGQLNNTFGQLALKNTSNTIITSMTYGTQPSAGDYDADADVDGTDFLAWQRSLGSPVIPAGSGADGDGSGTVDAGDLTVWTANFGSSTAVAAASVTREAPTSTVLVSAVIERLNAPPGAVVQTVESTNVRYAARRDPSAFVASRDHGLGAWAAALPATPNRELRGADASDLVSERDSLNSAVQLEHALDLAFASLAI